MYVHCRLFHVKFRYPLKIGFRYITATVRLPTNLLEFYKPLSLRVYQVLEDIGVSTDMRNAWIEYSTADEIMMTINGSQSITHAKFGSSFEGSRTLGMDSDVDCVAIANDHQVVTDCQANLRRTAFLMINDSSTPAGYAKLQLVKDGIPLYSDTVIPASEKLDFPGEVFEVRTDKENRLCCVFDQSAVPKVYDARHGPAMTLEDRPAVADVDLVLGLRCENISDTAKEWLNRKRQHNWPNPEVLETCEKLGCLFVPKGHPDSVEEPLLWRMSFSYQERLLVCNFNSTQLQCFVLLKLMKNELVNKNLPHGGLSSYHCKTCMLFVIENTPSQFWKPYNLLACLTCCLNTLYSMSQTGICPNYFIPSKNMFKGRLTSHSLTCLKGLLHDIISADFKWLLHLKTDNFGSRLGQMIISRSSILASDTSSRTESLNVRKVQLKIASVQTALIARNAAIKECFPDNIQELAALLFNDIRKLKERNIVKRHGEEHIESAVNLIQPFIETSLMSNLVAAAAQSGKESSEFDSTCRPTNNSILWNYLSSDKWNQISAISDAVSSKLKQACHLHMVGHYEASLDILEPLESRLGYPICNCDHLNPQVCPKIPLSHSRSCSSVEILKNFLTPCVVFLPTEHAVTPTALCYEMIRSFAMATDLRIRAMYYWYDWAVIDGRFLYHFLQYLNHRSLGMALAIVSDITNMLLTMRAFDISHKETALNILGWVYRQEGLTELAWDCVRRSLGIRPGHNAARWHMLFQFNSACNPSE